MKRYKLTLTEISEQADAMQAGTIKSVRDLLAVDVPEAWHDKTGSLIQKLLALLFPDLK